MPDHSYATAHYSGLLESVGLIDIDRLLATDAVDRTVAQLEEELLDVLAWADLHGGPQERELADDVRATKKALARIVDNLRAGLAERLPQPEQTLVPRALDNLPLYVAEGVVAYRAAFTTHAEATAAFLLAVNRLVWTVRPEPSEPD